MQVHGLPKKRKRKETCYLSQVLKTWRLVQEISEEKLFIRSRQIARQMPAIET